MFKNMNAARSTLCAGILWMLASCAATQPVVVEPIPLTESPSEHVNRLDSDLGSARNSQLNVLAPDAFERAERYLNAAKTGLDRGQEISDILQNVSRGRAELRSAEETAKVVRTVLAESIGARSLARAAGATELIEDYARVENNFLDLTSSIERNSMEWAKRNQGKVTEDFRQLELRAIKEKTLGEVRDLIAAAENAGARMIVPETLALARKELDEADSFISEQRYNTAEIQKKAANALFLAQRLNQVMALTQDVQSMDSEKTSLFIEGVVQQITGKLAAADMRNEPLDLQVANIIASIDSLQKDRLFMVEKSRSQQAQIEDMIEQHQMEIDSMSRNLASLEGKTKEEQLAKEQIEAEKRAVEDRLEAERRFNKLYIEVQNFFEPAEAEVYKQGYQLVIRLKDMKFPVGKAIVMPENYPILSKVQRAIRTFGEPDVTIEGHTDSTGSAAVNDLLSQQRAEAVSEYLIANRTLPADKILAVGYGPQRPLASNATAEGRAINRRIDVIIKPVAVE
ncbi:MAG: OmpA family protein [Nitrospiraceae bacterium]|nr:MAG: OmpA family protein [Nitrospiraceae bacterium]